MTPAPLTLDRPQEVAALVDGFLAGGGSLSGLGLYYALEQATPLLQFHTMLRSGRRNQEANGLQQSYGDHNRLLLLGLDKLVDGDLEWYRTRLDEMDDVSDEDLRECFAGVAALGLNRPMLIALWLGAALHDCGMLGGRGSYVDVEDGVVLATNVIDALCPPELVGLARFALRHHDYIKDRFTGEVPASEIATDLAALDPSHREVGLAALGMIQVAGAASLGTGRLGSFRIEIFRRCAGGDALDHGGPSDRLARLLQDEPSVAVNGASDLVGEVLAARSVAEQAAVEGVLATVPVHGWHRVAAPLPATARIDLLLGVAGHLQQQPADRIVLAPTLDAAHIDRAATSRDRALSGSRVLLLQP